MEGNPYICFVEKDYKSIRTSYEKHELYIEDLPENPILGFKNWFDFAIHKKVLDPNAFVLSTVNEKNKPSSRVVLVKDVVQEGILFFSNYSSKKGKELEHSPHVCLNFFWPELERQVRIEGVAERISSEESDAYFYSRPLESQYGAMASLQSKKLEDRRELEQRLEQVSAGEAKRPNDWGGYLIRPNYFEFWQGRPSRLHDRITFERVNDQWKSGRLYP